MCVWIWICVYEFNTEEDINPQKLESQAVLSLLMWILEQYSFLTIEPSLQPRQKVLVWFLFLIILEFISASQQ